MKRGNDLRLAGAPEAVSRDRRPTAEQSRGIMFLRRILRRGNQNRAATRDKIRGLIRAYLSWNRRLMLDAWMRYHPAVSLISTDFPNGAVRILDVGCGGAGLPYFLARRAVGVDIQFAYGSSGVTTPLLVPVRASATHLPFRDGSFDIAISMDTIEHIAEPLRALAVEELFRVGERLVILGFPFGPLSSRFDEMASLEE